MSKKNNENDHYLQRDLDNCPEEIRAKIDKTKPGWKTYFKKLMTEYYNTHADFSQPVRPTPKEQRKMYNRMVRESVNKRIAEIKAKQEAEKFTAPTSSDSDVPKIIDAEIVEKTDVIV